MVRTPIDARPDVRALDQVRVATSSGGTLPLAQLARVEFSSAPTEIRRYNRQRAVTIDADVKSGYNTDRVTKDVLNRLDQMQWPRGYSYVPGGELETRTESFGGLQSALIIALLGIVAILVLEFGNFKSTLIVLTVVPFGIAGGILLLGLTGNTISFTATIGFIALDRHRDQELDPARRSSPIVCAPKACRWTKRSSAAGEGALPADPAHRVRRRSAGLLPLALQNSAMYSPLAWVIIGGLLSSTSSPASSRRRSTSSSRRRSNVSHRTRGMIGSGRRARGSHDGSAPCAPVRNSPARRPARRPRRPAPLSMRSLSGLPSATITSGMCRAAVEPLRALLHERHHDVDADQRRVPRSAVDHRVVFADQRC
jgi:hypothetical protein